MGLDRAPIKFQKLVFLKPPNPACFPSLIYSAVRADVVSVWVCQGWPEWWWEGYDQAQFYDALSPLWLYSDCCIEMPNCRNLPEKLKILIFCLICCRPMLGFGLNWNRVIYMIHMMHMINLIHVICNLHMIHTRHMIHGWCIWWEWNKGRPWQSVANIMKHWIMHNDDGDDESDSDDIYIIGAVCLSVCHVFAYFPVCV